MCQVSYTLELVFSAPCYPSSFSVITIELLKDFYSFSLGIGLHKISVLLVLMVLISFIPLYFFLSAYQFPLGPIFCSHTVPNPSDIHGPG